MEQHPRRLNCILIDGRLWTVHTHSLVTKRCQRRFSPSFSFTSAFHHCHVRIMDQHNRLLNASNFLDSLFQSTRAQVYFCSTVKKQYLNTNPRFIISCDARQAIQVSKFIRLLKLQKEKSSLRGEEPQMKCSKCEKREATDPDGLCNHCRFDNVLMQMRTERE